MNGFVELLFPISFRSFLAETRYGLPLAFDLTLGITFFDFMNRKGFVVSDIRLYCNTGAAAGQLIGKSLELYMTFRFLFELFLKWQVYFGSGYFSPQDYIIVMRSAPVSYEYGYRGCHLNSK